MYGGGDSDRAEVAKDVAAFANYQGGLIMIGVTDSDGVAISVDPWDVTETDELRIREIVTERVVPYIDIAIQRVASQDARKGFLLIAVPGSNDAPHAVQVVGDKVRYPFTMASAPDLWLRRRLPPAIAAASPLLKSGAVGLWRSRVVEFATYS